MLYPANMKKTSTGPLWLCIATILLGLACNTRSAPDSNLTINVGQQAPPAQHVENRWQSPYQTAVWIAGHNEWNEKHYVWMSGYYSYPPRENSHWIVPVYSREKGGNYYRPGYWSNYDNYEVYY